MQILLPLLDSSKDLVVRLSTAKALKVIIDDFEFSSEELEPYLGLAFQRLFHLLKEVQECDTKVREENKVSNNTIGVLYVEFFEALFGL